MLRLFRNDGTVRSVYKVEPCGNEREMEMNDSFTTMVPKVFDRAAELIAPRGKFHQGGAWGIWKQGGGRVQGSESNLLRRAEEFSCMCSVTAVYVAAFECCDGDRQDARLLAGECERLMGLEIHQRAIKYGTPFQVTMYSDNTKKQRMLKLMRKLANDARLAARTAHE